MMYCKAVIAIALVAAVSHSSAFILGFPNPINSVQNAVLSTVNTAKTSAQTGIKMVNDGVQGATGAGQQVIDTVTGLKSTALKGGVDAASQGIDIGTNLASAVPVVGSFAGIGGDLAKTGLNAGSSVGQAVINTGSAVESAKLGVASGVATAGTGIASQGVSIGADLANTGTRTGFGLVNKAVDTVSGVVDTKLNMANQAIGGLSALAGGASLFG